MAHFLIVIKQISKTYFAFFEDLVMSFISGDRVLGFLAGSLVGCGVVLAIQSQDNLEASLAIIGISGVSGVLFIKNYEQDDEKNLLRDDLLAMRIDLSGAKKSLSSQSDRIMELKSENKDFQEKVQQLSVEVQNLSATHPEVIARKISEQ